ncbi:hypothetical protein DID88_003370 [Monilinia fructigena]|uniref:Uncharacterized protein n=1 Tax=Monilinia fructigena TaxID=38457 RepID=A0A395IWD4_9HELO|nr:hypothetical protein DID88_003370 [Monilinia fructigena]
MILQSLLIAFLGITSVIASQPSSATNACIEALLTKPGNSKDFCIQYLLLGTIPVPSFASPCLSTSPSDQQLFKSCYEILTRLAKEVPLPTALHFDEIEKPSKRGESLARDGGSFNTGSVPSVSTNVGIYENVGCFEDGVRGKPLGSPLLNLIGGPAATIQSCANACSILGRNGIPYLYAGVEPGSSCPSTLANTVGVPVSSASVVVSSLSPSGNSTSSSSSLTTSQALISRSSSISTIVSTTPEISQSIISASIVSKSFVANETPFISLSLTAASSATRHSFGLPPDPPTIPPIVEPTGIESYILPSGSFTYPSEVLATAKPNPWISLSLKEPHYYTQIDSDAVPGDPLYTPTPLLLPTSLVVPFPTTSIIKNLNTISSSSSTSSTPLPRASPSPDSSTIHVSATTSPSPSTSSPTLNPTNPWAGLSLEDPDYYTQVPSDLAETSSKTTSLQLPLFKKSKREYNIYAPDSPWASILPLTSPEIVKEIPPGQVPGWEQQAIAPPSDKLKREYDIIAPNSPWFPAGPNSPSQKAKREYDITAPDSSWLPLLPLSRPEVIKEVPPGQVPGWQGQPSAPLIPNSDVPPKAKPKGKLHRRQIGAIPENALEPPGRPDFIKEFPEKNNNKPPPPPFDKIKDPVDPKTRKKIEKKKAKYSHSKISLKKRPSLKDIGLQQDGREIGSQGQIGKGVSQKRIKDHRYRHKLHLQGTPKAYSEMEEEMARRQRGEVKNTVEEWEKKIFGGFGKAKEGWMKLIHF